MRLLPSSVALSNLFTLLCRLISCDNRYQSPVVGDAFSGRSLEGLDLQDRSNFETEAAVPVAVTRMGTVSGYYMTIIRGRKIVAFEGIPYAEPPIGDRRFRSPVPKASWSGSGTLNANDPGPVCMQIHYGRLLGSEDCLRLNVYTPSLNPSKSYSVILYIHGGFSLSGSGSYFGPAYLLEHDVILVTFNYRLGSLGYFSTGDAGASGNWGLRDQALVIQWVVDNIAAFGGNPQAITLSGYSAGGVSTHLHMISNYATKDYFRNAISMSGTGYNIWGLNSLNTSRLVGLELSRVSGCSVSQDSESVLKCMRNLDASVLVANQLLIFGTGFFLPSIEPPVPGAFLTQTPDKAYSTGRVARIPWIATMTYKELDLPITGNQANVVVSLLRAAFTSDLSSLLSFRRRGVNEDRIRRRILKFYSGSDSVNSLSRKELSKIARDRYFAVSIRKAIQMHSQIAPTYASIFNYSSNLGLGGRRGLDPSEIGVLHGDDLVYFLNSTVSHPSVNRFDAHFAITKLLVNLYGNFAQYGEPLFTSEDEMQYKIWDPIENQERLRFLRIDEEVKMIEDPFKDEANFWESLQIPGTTSYFRL